MSRSLFGLACLLAVVSGAADAGTLVSLKNPAPEGVLVAYQLTDGRVIVQADTETHFFILTPDQNGSYMKGTWTQAKTLPSGYSPYAFSGAVLADGRVVVQGGGMETGASSLVVVANGIPSQPVSVTVN